MMACVDFLPLDLGARRDGFALVCIAERQNGIDGSYSTSAGSHDQLCQPRGKGQGGGLYACHTGHHLFNALLVDANLYNSADQSIVQD